jgi:hypothetical protein
MLVRDVKVVPTHARLESKLARFSLARDAISHSHPNTGQFKLLTHSVHASARLLMRDY